MVHVTSRSSEFPVQQVFISHLLLNSVNLFSSLAPLKLFGSYSMASVQSLVPALAGFSWFSSMLCSSAFSSSCSSSSSTASTSSLVSVPILRKRCAKIADGRKFGRKSKEKVSRAMLQQTVQGASANYAKEMERLSAKESLLLAVCKKAISLSITFIECCNLQMYLVTEFNLFS